jgi:hypothetical protein
MGPYTDLFLPNALVSGHHI